MIRAIEEGRTVGGSAPDLVPARMLNEFCYCPRLGYLEWSSGEFAHNLDTHEGRFGHRRVDREQSKELPAPTGDGEHDEHRLHARSVMLSSESERLIAKMDLLELDGSLATPVDYKRGKVPDNPEQSWEPERVQLCAQGLILRDAGYQCDRGILYFIGSRRRVTIEFDDLLVARTRQLVGEFRRIVEEGRIPVPLIDSPKCPRCSLVGICLPDETNRLRDSEIEEPTAVRRLLPARGDAVPMYVQEQGARVGKSGERIQIKKGSTVVDEARLIDVSQLSLFGNVQTSAQVLAELLDRNIPVCHFSYGGWFRGITAGLSHKNVELRIAQFQSTLGPKAILLARSFVVGKIKNARTLLRRNSGAGCERTLSLLAQFARDAQRAESIERLLGIEGMAAKTYFAGFAGLFGKDLGFEMDGRNRRPPTDPINALLSFLYAVLTKEVTIAVQSVGFDPMLGFLHQPRYGRPSLALDLVEEFRPLIADSVVLSLVNTGEIEPGDFVSRAGAVALTPTGRKAVLLAYERRMDSLVTHPIFGYRICYRRVLEVQARLLARTVTGEIPEYPSFQTR